MDPGVLEPTLCQIGLVVSEHVGYPENTHLEECMVSGPKVI